MMMNHHTISHFTSDVGLAMFEPETFVPIVFNVAMVAKYCAQGKDEYCEKSEWD
jgi:hypothetical protein